MMNNTKIISWNVNGLRAVINKGFMDFFNKIDSDIFAIQETKMQEGQLEINLDDIILIAIPFTLQIFLVFAVGYLSAKLLKIPQNIAAPASMVGASNFFELAVAIAIALYGIGSPVALATTVGVLIEVPLMLTLVKIINNTKEWYNGN